MRRDRSQTAGDAAGLIALSALLLAACFIHEGRTLGTIGPTLDDTFIHLRFAWNLVRGQGFAFNPAEPLPGSTSPLWVLLLAPFARGDKGALIAAAIVMSALAYLPLGALAAALARRAGASRGMGLIAGALVATNGRLLWAGVSGMETDLFAALSLLGAWVYLGEAGRGKTTARTGLIFGLAAAVRPEGYLLFAGVVLHELLVRRKRGGRPGLRARLAGAPWAAIAVFAGLIAPYMIFAWATTGDPLPTTFAAKNVDFSRYHGRYLHYSALYFFLDNPAAAAALIGAAALAAVRTARARLGFLASADALVVAWPLGYLAVSAALTPMPFHFCRYQLPVLPFALIACVRAAEWSAGRWAERRGALAGRRAATAGSVLLLLGAAAGHLSFHQGRVLLRWPSIATTCAKNILEMQVKVGDWLARASEPGDLVATMDIGAIGFYSERKVLDLVGLISPEVPPLIRGKGHGPERSAALLALLARRRPRFLAVFPEMYPGLAADAKVFSPLLEIRLTDNQIAAYPGMVLYQCRWPEP